MDTLRIAAVVAVAALAACSGGKGGALTPGVPLPAKTATPSTPSSGTRAMLTIVVPRATTGTTGGKRVPRYVSPSTAALQVAVNGGAAANYGLSASSPGCAVIAGVVTCTFAIAAPAGNDTLALTLSDGGGNVLSRNNVTAKVVAGATTPVDVTLAGVPTSVVVVPGAGAVVDTNDAPYHAPGLAPQPVEVEALDADGNIIIGAGAPTIGSVTMASGASFASVAKAPTTDPAAFLLTPVDGSAGGQTVSVSATVQGIPLADGTTSQPLTGTTSYLFTPAIAITGGPIVQIASVESGRLVRVFSVCGGGCGIVITGDAAADAKGNLYIAWKTFGTTFATSLVSEYVHGAITAAYELTAAQGVHSVGGIAVDKNGTLYVANGATGGFKQPHLSPAVTEYTFGAMSPTFTIANTSSQPGGIAVDPAGNVFVSDPFGSATVSEYAPNSQTVSATLSDPSLALPEALVADASGGLYASDGTNLDVAYFAAGQTTVTTTLSDVSFANNVNHMMIDPGGNLWASLGAGNSVEQLSAAALPNAVSIGQIIPTSGGMAWIP